MQKLVCIAALLALAVNVQAQDFYDMDHIPEVKIYFEETNWDEILDSLYIVGNEARLHANVTIDGEAFLGVGVRYKGYSSYSPSRDKNPFNLDLDYSYQWQEYQGYKKIKLSNSIQDPSFLREALSYKIARQYTPASQANFANVYVNDTLIGLYTNVEAVNTDFLEKHFLESGNAFVKCNPETVSLNGANSNLELLDSDLESYYDLYDIKSTNSNDWHRLYEFIEVLNNDPSNIEALLNVDRALWMHALNYVLVNFDSYVGYAQNYYLYQTSDGRFQPILWDLNMSFASYRLSDASDHWDGFSIDEAKLIDPLQHLNSFSVQERPLIRNLLENDQFKRMYLAHIKTIVEESINSGDYYSWAQQMQNIIENSVLNDTNKFYSDAFFYENLDSTVTDFVDYPGIKDLMEGRATYLINYPGMSWSPSISSVTEVSNTGLAHNDFWITANIQSSLPVSAYCMFKSPTDLHFESVQMFDDGNHNDGLAGDGVFGAFFDDPSYGMDYYLYAENDSAGMFYPQRAAYEFETVDLRMTSTDLVINEYMIQNSYITDASDELDPWLELYVSGEANVHLGDLVLISALTGEEWELPEVEVPSNGYQTIWLDADTNQGAWHASFKGILGDTLTLQYPNGTVVDQIALQSYSQETSLARFPNGIGDFLELRPTPAAENQEQNEALFSDELYVYPNPASIMFNVRLNSAEALVQLWSQDGRLIFEQWCEQGTTTIQLNDVASGAYLLSAQNDNNTETKRIIIQK
ncbi:MAG: hypothetical protein Crog4KO_05460 [Crocinitomicaceae bacterium]